MVHSRMQHSEIIIVSLLQCHNRQQYASSYRERLLSETDGLWQEEGNIAEIINLLFCQSICLLRNAAAKFRYFNVFADDFLAIIMLFILFQSTYSKICITMHTAHETCMLLVKSCLCIMYCTLSNNVFLNYCHTAQLQLPVVIDSLPHPINHYVHVRGIVNAAGAPYRQTQSKFRSQARLSARRGLRAQSC